MSTSFLSVVVFWALWRTAITHDGKMHWLEGDDELQQTHDAFCFALIDKMMKLKHCMKR